MLLPLAAVQVRAGQDVRDGPKPAKIVLLNDLETKTSCIKLYIKIETIAAIDDKIFVSNNYLIIFLKPGHDN